MDQIGTLEISWAQGYNGSNTQYISRDTVCFACGNNVKFVSEEGQESFFPSPGEGVGPLAVHAINKVFAFSELCLNPRIFVVDFPSFKVHCELKDGAQLEFSHLAFSSSNYLVSVSGVPQFELTLWNYLDNTRLCTTSLAHTTPTSVSVNPADWRKICVSTNNKLTVWNVDQSNTEYKITPTNVKLPSEYQTIQPEEKERDVMTRASTRMSRAAALDLPKAAIAGLVGELAEDFEGFDNAAKVVPTSHVWSPNGDVIIGCKGGQLLKLDGELYKIRVLYNPNAGKTQNVVSDNAINELEEDFNNIIGDGSMDCMALHKDGLYIGGTDGTLRFVDISGDEMRFIESYPLGVAISTLGFNTLYNKLAIGSPRGTLHLYDPSDPGNMKECFDNHYGNFVAISCLTPGTEQCVTCREDGEVQVWDVATAKLLSTMPIGVAATCLASSPLCHIVCIGTSSGFLYVCDFNKLDSPRIIHRVRLHNGPLKHIVFDDDGKYMFTAGDDGHVILLHAKPSKEFQAIGHTGIEGDVNAISVHKVEAGCIKVIVTSNTTENKRSGANKLIQFDIKDEMVNEISGHRNLKCLLREESIKKISSNFTVPCHGAALTEGGIFYTLEQNTKNILKIKLPTEPPKKAMSKDSFLVPISETPGHQLPGGRITMSPHKKWISSVGTDGMLNVRAVGNMDSPLTVHAHDYRHGGVHCSEFSRDMQHNFTAGYDGVLSCYKWNLAPSGIAKAKSAVDASRNRHKAMLAEEQREDEIIMNLPDWAPASGSSRPQTVTTKEEREKIEKENAIINDTIYTTPTPTPESDATWVEVKELEAIKEEDKEYADVKKQLRTEIRDIRRTIQDMMKSNEVVADIEKLGHHEFDLDVQEQKRMQEEGEAQIRQIVEEIELENLGMMYLKDVIKKECWDDMVVKGRALESFNGILEVANYPMRERDPAVLAELERVTNARRIEFEEQNTRRELVDNLQKPTTNTGPADDDLADGDETEEDTGEKPSTSGSFAEQFGGGNELFYSQFELHLRHQKVNQIVLLEDAIHRIKEAYNKEFSGVFDKKLNEIAKIKEKNKRIRKILNDLNLLDQLNDFNDPEVGMLERPEQLLIVNDEEVKMEKHLTAEERKKVEEYQRAEAERIAKEKGDNARERALDMMMGGVLEIKMEDELKKDVPKPAFMSQKPEEEWSEDDLKMVAEYEKKVQTLNEEREKYKKQLESELKKLQLQITETMETFDQWLNNLFTRKIKTEMCVYQEELKIVRLRYSLMVEDELNSREAELMRLLHHKAECKELAAEACNISKKNYDEFHEQYDILTAEDKVMDKAFKREFNDVTALQVDQLYKLFRRRPRGKGGIKGHETPIYEAVGNPFADRPSTARKNKEAADALESAMAELDKETNAPDGVEMFIWERMCKYRRQKMHSEQMVKQKALVMAEMNAFLQRCQAEDDHLKDEIEGLKASYNRLKEEKEKFMMNLDVQLVVKQGQVEVDPQSWIHNFSQSLLIHRSVIEDLNGRIKHLGDGKILSMKESKDFKKGIIQLEWEHKKMIMEMEDLKEKMRDVTTLKVTREIQSFLNEEDHEAKKSQEASVLEQTLVMQKKHHEKTVAEKKTILKDLNRTAKEKEDQNNEMDIQLAELNVSVNERGHINEVNADKRSDSGAEKRYADIVQRRKLVDLAKAQAQEVAVLRAEVERLRMRTFPALVQVEH
ncbi:unnamed protein product [Owenia fusiformis]|uniref:Cilia- and flagella-associated protein 43 n=1 Tax=Owenia fusiformis TaxID=6347 RepID=A0A8S4NUH8_OWEFU|nr:unnamed protein product [Owenia fusiformis]